VNSSGNTQFDASQRTAQTAAAPPLAGCGCGGHSPTGRSDNGCQTSPGDAVTCWEESPGPSQSPSASLGSNPEAGQILALFKRLAEDGIGQHRQSGSLPIEVPNAKGETVTYLEVPMGRLPADD
jgi:hypothetical protein